MKFFAGFFATLYLLAVIGVGVVQGWRTDHQRNVTATLAGVNGKVIATLADR